MLKGSSILQSCAWQLPWQGRTACRAGGQPVASVSSRCSATRGAHVTSGSICSAGRRRRQAQRWPRLAQAAGGENAPGGSEELEEAFKRALPEAEELYARAVKLAEEQTRRELLQSLASEAGPGGADAGAPSSALRVEEEALLRVWLDEGVKQTTAVRLAARCIMLGGPQADADALFARLERWRRVLPGASVKRIVERDDALLTADISLAIRNVLALTTALPKLDVVKLVEDQPSLLWAEDVGANAQVAMRLLRGWSPKSDPQVILENYPELIQRLPKYYDGFEFFQLPIEIQNVMAVGSGGGGTQNKHLREQTSWEFDDNDTY